MAMDSGFVITAPTRDQYNSLHHERCPLCIELRRMAFTQPNCALVLAAGLVATEWEGTLWQ